MGCWIWQKEPVWIVHHDETGGLYRGYSGGVMYPKKRKKINQQPPLASGQRGLSSCFAAYQVTYSSQNRMSMTAAWARVAWPWGLRVEPSPVPLMIPAPTAHCIAEMAYSLRSATSV